MNRRLRSPQSIFFSTLASALFATLVAFPALLATVPLMAIATGEKANSDNPAAAGSTVRAQPQQEAPSFEKLDRNKDGYLDKSEAGAVPGLSANFEKADTIKDGKLDTAEFARALATLDLNK